MIVASIALLAALMKKMSGRIWLGTWAAAYGSGHIAAVVALHNGMEVRNLFF